MERAVMLVIVAILLVFSASVVFAAATEESTTLKDIVFCKAGSRTLRMNLTLPAGAPEKKSPAIIWIHGGGWFMGDRNADLTEEWGLNGHGFVTGSIEYRLSQEAKYPAQIEDCKAAIRFLRANADKYGIDADRIGVWGGSAGGHLAALLGTTADIKRLDGDGDNLEYSSRVQAVCVKYGPTDFSDAAMQTLIPEVVEMVSALLGGPVSENRGLARMASPVEFVSKDDPPTLILQGDSDPLVPLSQGEALYKALKRVGADVTFVEVKKGGHGFGPIPKTEPSFDELKKTVLEFFQKHLMD